MKLYRIKAIMVRHLLLTFRVFQRLVDLMFWPFLNLVLWGFNSMWNESFQQQPAQVTLALLTGLVVWQILFRVNMEICSNLLEELTSHNFSGLFSTPLKLSEWMIAVVGIGFIKSIFTFIFAVSCIWLLYDINILTVGWFLAACIGLIILTGWSIGFLTASGIVYWGQSVRELVWVVAWIFVPFSGIFYSIKILPQWVQKVAAIIPQSHLFEALRTYILEGKTLWDSLLICLILTVFYLILSLTFFKLTFEKSRSNGLSRLENN